MRRIIGHSLLLLLLAGGCSRATAPDFDETEPRVEVLSVATLKARCGSATRTTVHEEIAVQGLVTGNDRYGEYDRQLVIEDASGGLVINLDDEELHRRYPVGTRVTLYCNGLTLTNYGGRFEVLTDPDDRYGTGGIPAAAVTSYLRVAATAGEAPRPTVCPLTELGAAMLDRYVRVEGVRFTDRTVTWCRRDLLTEEFLPTEHPIADRAGNTFIVRTPATVAYVLEPLPEGEVALCGIVGSYGGHYTLRIVDRGVYYD